MLRSIGRKLSSSSRKVHDSTESLESQEPNVGRTSTEFQSSLKASKSVYYEIMKPTIIVLAICGLYIKPGSRWPVKIYPYAVVAILWFNAFKFCSAYEFFYGGNESMSAILIIKIVTNLWFFGCCSLHTCLIVNQSFASREASLVQQLDLLLDYNIDSEKIGKKLLRRLNLINFGLFLFGIFNSSAIFISYFGPKELFNAFALFLTPFHKTEWAAQSVPYKLFTAITCSFTSITWMMSLGYYSSHCLIIRTLFDNFNQKFVDFIQNNVIVSSEVCPTDRFSVSCGENLYNRECQKNFACEPKFEQFRRWHLKLTQAVRTIDKCYQHFVAISLSIYIPIALLLLYILSDWNGSCVQGILQILYPFWTASSLLIIALTVIMASRIHSAAHDCLDDLFNIDLEKFSMSLCFKVNMMISRLSGDKIGLTSLGLFVITNDFILTVVGTLLTYFFVAFQFKDSSKSGEQCSQ
nr:G protein-coupled receptor [Proales similis]